MKNNKFDVLNKVVRSNLRAQDKCLLVELVLRSDDNWYSWPSVQRLAQARGIRHEKNFKGAEVYLPGLVTKSKVGRKNGYTLNVAAIMALGEVEVVIKHTPALAPAGEGSDHPADADDTPGQADDTPGEAENVPAKEGANSSKNTTENSSENITEDSSTDGEESLRATSPSVVTPDQGKVPLTSKSSFDEDWDSWEESLGSTTGRRLPARAGVSSVSIDEVW